MKPRILMVDDEADLAMIVRAWLEPAYDVRACLNEEEFESALLTVVPDLAIFDLYLPGADGYELCRRLRSRPGLENVPVLFLTGSGRVEDYRRSLVAGGNAYLMKPISRARLLAAIADLLPQPCLQEDGGGD